MKNDDIKIETITTPENNEVSFCPYRGGIITSIKFKGKEILYLDEATLQNKELNVRGGIPILFPNAGPLESPLYPNLKQHGFARNSSNWKIEKTLKGFRGTLISDNETMAIFPFNFRFSTDANFKENGSFTINQEVENLEKPARRGGGKELPISMGLHPYFKVPQNKKNEIKFNFEGGKFIEEQIENWANGKYISIDNPKVKNPNAVMEIVIPSLGILEINASSEYKKIWIWSLPEKDFICIEPVMRDVEGLVGNPENIKINEIFRASVNFSLKEVK